MNEKAGYRLGYLFTSSLSDLQDTNLIKNLRVILTPTEIPKLYHVTTWPFLFPKLSQENIWASLVQISDALKLDSATWRAGWGMLSKSHLGQGLLRERCSHFPGWERTPAMLRLKSVRVSHTPCVSAAPQTADCMTACWSPTTAWCPDLKHCDQHRDLGILPCHHTSSWLGLVGEPLPRDQSHKRF